MPYKGLALAETLYGDIALRQSGDIDLLILPQNLRGIRDAVRELGYAPHQHLSEMEERAYLKSGYECVSTALPVTTCRRCSGRFSRDSTQSISLWTACFSGRQRLRLPAIR